MDIKSINEELRAILENYEDISFSIGVDQYTCRITITNVDGKFKYEEDMIGHETEAIYKTPLEAFNDCKDYLASFLEGDENNVDNDAYVTEFNYDDDLEEKLEKFGYECYKADLNEGEEIIAKVSNVSEAPKIKKAKYKKVKAIEPEVAKIKLEANESYEDDAKKAKELIATIDKKLEGWNERSNFSIKGVKNLSRSDLDMLRMYAENVIKTGGFNGLMSPLGAEKEVLDKFGLKDNGFGF